MGAAKPRPFDARVFLDSTSIAKKVVVYQPGTTVYSQGDPADTVFYVRQGRVKLTVLSRTGKEAVIAVLGQGDFFGEGALAGQPRRLATAVAMAVSDVLVVPKRQMIRLLHQQHDFSDRFITHMLARNIRLEEDLIDQLFNASEKRLARALLLLARYGKSDGPQRILPRVSQEMLADMVGTTRPRINFFMNKFRKLGFIEHNGAIKVHDALLAVVLLDPPL